MDPLYWIAVAAIGGAILGVLSNYLLAGTMTGKQFLAQVITGIVAAIGFAVSYNFLGATLKAFDVLSAIVGGWGLVTGVASSARLAREGTLLRKTRGS